MEKQEVDTEGINVAKWLMLLSRGHATAREDGDYTDVVQPSADRVFECKTCNRRFSSFQALGGHRASHKKPKFTDDGHDRTRRRTHECSICGLPFAIGQALGGHMRKHRNELFVAPAGKRLKTSTTHAFRFDLNLTPFENYFLSAFGMAGKIDVVH